MCKFIAVTNRKLCREDFLERIHLLCEAGVDRIVLREKDLSSEEYEVLAREVLAVCESYDTVCVLHKYAEAVKNLSAPGIHLSIPDALKQENLRRDFSMVGISTHSIEQVKQAQQCGADYVFYGHVFPTDCKKDVPARGLESLKEICQSTELPVYAIGGISPENAEKTIRVGASGICVMSWGMQAEKEEIQSFVRRCHKF